MSQSSSVGQPDEPKLAALPRARFMSGVWMKRSFSMAGAVNSRTVFPV